jgi:hypothetical protein
MLSLRLALLVGVATLLTPALAHAADFAALQPFPTNLQTVPDATQPTGLHVQLPTPNCATAPSDCADVALINGLDGFNLQPRISVPFSAPVDLATVSSSTIGLYDTGCLACAPVGIDQVVWEPAADTLHFEPGSLLKEGATYLLVVTTGVRSSAGAALARTTFLKDLNFGQTKDLAAKAYRKQLKAALDATGTFEQAGAASLFTTQTATDELQAIRAQLDAMPAAAATIEADIPLAQITGMSFRRQVRTAPPNDFTTSTPPFAALLAVPGAVGRIVFGSYVSPQYETAQRVIPPTPSVQSTETIRFNLFLPAAPAPAGGYPVALFGHGFGDNKNNSPFVVAASMAARGVATIAINVVGHGGGAAGTLTVGTATGAVTVPAGGRGIDQDGNGSIDATEGVNAAAPFALVSSRDGLRQTVIDLIELARVIRAGHIPGLSTSRIYYFGQSFGGIYGTELMGTDPLVRAGVLNVPGGPIIDIARLSPVFRPLVGTALFFRTPNLYDVDPPNAPFYTNFVENMPLRGQPILVDTQPGASAIQEYLDRAEWVQQAGSPVPYARLITHPVIFQFAKGDMTVPNPTTTAILRAGDLAGRATYFRNDIAGPGGTKLYANPHTFLTSLPAVSAFQAQAQIATFLASDGTVTVDPDGPGPVFETPIAGPLPEGTNF